MTATKDEMRMTNERDFHQDPNYVAPDKEKEKLVLQLGTMITDRYLKKYTHTLNVNDPEYWDQFQMSIEGEGTMEGRPIHIVANI